jgi:hypothetical protein
MRLLVSNCGNDSSTVTSTRIPDDLETQRLYEYAYEGRAVDF